MTDVSSPLPDAGPLQEEPPTRPTRDPLGVLWAPATIRLRCAAITQAVEEGRSGWFKLKRNALEPLAQDIADQWPLRGERPPVWQTSVDNPWSLWAAHAPQRLATLNEQWRAAETGSAAQSQADLSVLAVLLGDPPGSDWTFEDRADRATPSLALPAQRQQRDDLLALLNQASGAASTSAGAAAATGEAEGTASAHDASSVEGRPSEQTSAPQPAVAAEPVQVSSPKPAAQARSSGPAPLRGAAALAVAVLRAFQDGVFSGHPADPLRVDARVLTQLDAAALRAAFQAGGGPALPGLQARVESLRRLGAWLEEQARRTGRPARPCALLEEALSLPDPGDAASLMRLLACRLASVEPLGKGVLGLPAGDVWPHRWAGAQSDEGSHLPTAEWVPLHLRSRKMVLALAEPLRRHGIALHDLQGLPAGGDLYQGHIFLDREIVVPRDPRDRSKPRAPGDEWLTEWRALSTTLMDELATRVRAKLGLSEALCPTIALAEEPLLQARMAPVAVLEVPAIVN
jgi:Protein of unknown function (DUF1688)